MTLVSSSLLLLLAIAVSVATGISSAILMGPKDNKSTSALMGGALTAAATIPGLVIGFIVGSIVGWLR